MKWIRIASITIAVFASVNVVVHILGMLEATIDAAAVGHIATLV